MKNRLRLWPVLILVILIGVFLSSCGPAGAKERKGKVVLFIMDGVALEEVTQGDLPAFDQLLREGSIGLMNNRVFESLNSSKAYLTLGVGQRVSSSGWEGEAGDAGEKIDGVDAKALYRLSTGYEPGRKEVWHLNLANVKRFQEENAYGVEVGALGEALKTGGIKTACLGNSDQGNVSDLSLLRRMSVVIAMDSKGQVDRGNVGKNILQPDQDSPYGVRLDLTKLFTDFKRVSRECSFIVIDFGDVSRADMFQESALPEEGAKIKHNALVRADYFLRQILRELDGKNDILLIVVPTPPFSLFKPVPPASPSFVWGKGIKNGLITSPGTKRAGIFSNIDVGPTILKFFGLPKPQYFPGQPIEVTSFSGNKVKFLEQRSDQALFIDTIRGRAVIIYIVLLVILYASLLTTVVARRRSPLFSSVWRVGAVFILSYPLAFYLLPLFVSSWKSPWPGIAISFLLILTASVLSSVYFRERPQALLVASIPTLIFFLVDQFLHNPLSLDSIFGYSSLLGARFYGLGNDGYAIFLSVFILSVTLLLKPEKIKDRSVLAGLILLFLAFMAVDGLPSLGADVGGTITSLFALGVTLWKLAGLRVGWRSWLALIAAALILISAFALYDLSRPVVSQTHSGHTFSLLLRGQWEPLYATIARKTETNWRVLRFSNWSYLFILIFFALVFLNYRPIGWLKDFFTRQPVFYAAFNGSLVGGVIGFLTNDSGIVIPALLMAYFLTLLFWHLLLDYEKREKLTA